VILSSRRRQTPRFVWMRNGGRGGREADARDVVSSRSPASSASNMESGTGCMVCGGDEANVQRLRDGVGTAMRATSTVKVRVLNQVRIYWGSEGEEGKNGG
jgi:hypothetical protein